MAAKKWLSSEFPPPRSSLGMSEDDYSSSDEIEDGGAADFRGQLSSALVWDKNQLCFMLKQNVENGRKVLFKWKGQINTVTGASTYSGYLRKDIYQTSPVSMQRVLVAAQEAKQGARASDPHINPNRLLPAGFSSLLLKDWVLSPGLTFQSQANKKVNYALTLSKAPQFIRHSPKLDCWLTGKAHLLIDPKTAEVTSTASIRLKLLRYAFTDKQDLKLSVGLDLEKGSSFKEWSHTPYLQISENSLSLKMQKLNWSVLYAL